MFMRKVINKMRRAVGKKRVHEKVITEESVNRQVTRRFFGLSICVISALLVYNSFPRHYVSKTVSSVEMASPEMASVVNPNDPSLTSSLDMVADSVKTASSMPKLSCEKKWGEVDFQGKRFIRYRLRAKDFPAGQSYRLFVKWFNGEEAETFSYKANGRGHLILQEKRKEPLYALCPVKKGERIEFMMRSEEDPNALTVVSVVPFPLQLNTKTGVELSLELKDKEGSAFHLQGKGFTPGEVLRAVSSFQGQEFSYMVTASPDGAVSFPMVFDMRGQEGGECLLTFKRIEAGENITLPFQVGKGALEIAGGFVLEIR
jgi:hypothetical protein